MLNPSSTTATLPHGQFYPHHQSYLTNGSRVLSQGQNSYPSYHSGTARIENSAPSTTLNTPPTLPPPHVKREEHSSNSSRHPNQLPPIQSASQLALSQSDMSSRSRRYRQPNWNEFYKNGVPEEVIVIDDTPEPERRGRRDGSPYDRRADKKRKTAGSATYDPIYNNPQPSYSTTQTPYYDNSSANHTVSTDRTAPVYKGTGSSSIAPSTTNGASYYQQIEDGVVGQKRKRQNRAAEDAKPSKRREVDHPQSPFSAYVPPVPPIHKAKDVNVTVIRDTEDPKEKHDDADGHYIVEPSSELTDRYKIIKLLGQGTFGKVVEAYDKTRESKCAIKIIRSVQKYRDASRIELRVLSTLALNDRLNRNKCIHLRHCFDFRNHICIVTDLYGQSVFDFLKANTFTPFPNSHIQIFARQLLTSVAFLHDLNLIHTDLKPENILLVHSNYQTFTYNRTIPSSTTTTSRTSRHRRVLLDPEIRLIDFGSATFQDEYHSSVVSTRHYRAPEIILNLGWSFPCDLWSIGCILVEFFTGDALFQTHDNLEHLAMMEPICGGKIDKHLVDRVTSKERSNKNPAASYFTPRTKKLDYPNAETPRNSKKYVKAMKKLDATIPPNTDFNRQFLDLLKRIFVYDPAKRITAKQALQHPWFKEISNDDGTEAGRIRIEKEAKKAQEEQRLEQRRTNGY